MVVRLDTQALRRHGVQHHEAALDLLALAATVYAVDCLVPRKQAEDGWTRELAFEMPVADPALWETARFALERCLSFLSGDRWSITFTPRKVELWAPRREVPTPKPVQVVSLFSGGLDSTIGVINHLASTQDQLLLVGHSDTQTSGTKRDQEEVYGHINDTFSGRSELLQVHAGFDRQAGERTMRSRSFLFLALGVWASDVQGAGTPLLIPENGTIALNMPLTPTRTGSNSTRTTHPHYLELYREFLKTLGLDVPLINPLEDQTKGEAVRNCSDAALLKKVVALTNSCAKTNRRGHWVRRTPSIKHCGQCMPCLYRRAALHTAGWDEGQAYGLDLANGEVDLDGTSSGANDARALLYLIRRAPDRDELENRLFTNGPLEVGKRQDYARLVHTTLGELRTWVEDKGNPKVRGNAGV
ncbi:hypothetical protein E5F05_02045 (plasmid) [Deinococcus metallilatus]|uniref:ATPase n=1 Tax=Deinococcus metallilatus TaxID=1211322 RepID=A0ABR6MV50_9DEIO|nr:Qat anti-phage system QueC-like protein QatC [Deinococcus metallilatus]MBB5295822.1 hypothetical protein [Deinococcus metallilatus]QBY06751.1 hypothetical protein E5F05_02045 [Deinococcus metallilatus]